MLKRLLVPVLTAALLPVGTARAVEPGPVAAQAFYLAVLTGACALFVAGDRTGQGDEGFGRRGFYGTALGTYAAPGSSGGGGFKAGYRCHPNFAQEFEGQWLNSVQGSEPSRKANNYMKLTANTKAYLSRSQLQPFLLVGFGVVYAKRDASDEENVDHAVQIGTGFDYWFNEDVAITLDAKFTIPTGSAGNLWNVTSGAGVQYRF